ncbi:DsbA family protein [Microbacterium sp. CJ88]|uniref:DsbA family protein n=1 Tax=Microbacterium sp. CJ88 TaxID=3445672 RepID=UPI003F65E932
MSDDQSPHVPAPNDRRGAVREKAQQVQQRQSRARIIRRVSVGIGAVAVVAVAAVVVTWAFTSNASKPLLSPANVAGDGFVVTKAGSVASSGSADGLGSTPAPSPDPSVAAATPAPTPTPAPTATGHPTVDIRVYVDYLSSGSRDFQAANAQQLSKWVDQSAATLTYYPVAMLTAKSNGTKYSLRAANAAACVATHSPDKFFTFNNELLKKQPNVDSDGMTDAELATLAAATGVDSPKAIKSCIEDGTFSTWAKSATDRALKSIPDSKGVSLTRTPTVLVNGVEYVGALNDPKEFAQFVLTVASDAYYSTPTPTPSATGSATPAG